MGYSKEAYSAVKALLSERRQAARCISEKRRSQLYSDIPELEALDREQLSAGISASKAMLTCGTGAVELIENLKFKSDELAAAREEIFLACGIPSDYLDVPYTCKACCDSGYVGGAMCECMKKELKAEAYRRLNALSALKLSSFGQFRLDFYPECPDSATNVIPRAKMSEILNYCVRYADTFSPQSSNILMMGATGLGKTHLSLAIAGSVIEKGYGVIYGPAQNLLHSVELEHFGRAGAELSSLDSLLECDLLIIDDLGTEFQTSFTVSAIYNIVNTRLLTQKPTIISTNLTFEQLRDAYSEKVLSRLGGSYSFLRFFGSDIRQLLRNSR